METSLKFHDKKIFRDILRFPFSRIKGGKVGNIHITLDIK